MGVSLKFRKGFFFNLIFLFSFNEVYAQDKNPDRDSDETARLEYYKYWNPYRRVLDLRGEPQSFYGQIYYQATYNKDNRIKTVTRFGKDRKPKETYSLLWSRSGARSEYKVTFHELGNVSRLDKNLYSNELSNMRPGWVASFISRSDGRPKEVFLLILLVLNTSPIILIILLLKMINSFLRLLNRPILIQIKNL